MLYGSPVAKMDMNIEQYDSMHKDIVKIVSPQFGMLEFQETSMKKGKNQSLNCSILEPVIAPQ